ncbi:uncharacterized protein LOC135945949 [Cloeon dipterum]|uniref:uncharacterized protein LOC135945949 n=1 Tax=Cloeon dipterum TaxID=197152 RepID=UPI0032200566
MSSTSGSNKKSVKLITAVQDPALLDMSQSERAITKLLDKKGEAKAPKIMPIPRSAVLERVIQFLPKMEEAQRKLEDVQDKSELDIENISEEHKDNYIQFDLALANLNNEILAHLDDEDSSSDESSSASDSDCETDLQGNNVEKSKSSKSKNLITEL